MVHYLEINGKKYPIRLGYFVMKKIKEETGMGWAEALTKSGDDKDFSIHESILYHALVMGAKVDKVELDLTREDMEWALDFVLYEYMAQFSNPKFFPQEKLEEEEANKTGKQKVKTKVMPGNKQSKT